MLDKIRFPLVFEWGNTNGMLYIHGKDVKLKTVTDMIKNDFVDVCSKKYEILVRKGFHASCWTFNKESERVYVAISTALHFFKLELKDNVYRFTVYDYDKDEIIRDYILDDLLEVLTMDMLYFLTSAKTHNEEFSSMMDCLFIIINKRFLK